LLVGKPNKHTQKKPISAEFPFPKKKNPHKTQTPITADDSLESLKGWIPIQQTIPKLKRQLDFA
jgi:hypothetical protein